MSSDTIRQARSATESGDYERALVLWRELAARGSDVFTAREWYLVNFYLADTLNDLDDNVASLPYYRAAESAGAPLADKERLELRSRICYDALHVPDLPLARSYLDQIEAELIRTQQATILYNLGAAFAEQQDGETAQRLFEATLTAGAAIADFNAALQAYWELDDILKVARQFDDRLALADRCAELFPDQEDQLLCRLNAIESLLYTHRLAEAIARWPATNTYVDDLPEMPEMYQGLYFATAAALAAITEEPDRDVRRLADEAIRISRFDPNPLFTMKTAEQLVLLLTAANRYELGLHFGEIALEAAAKLPPEENPELHTAELAYDQAVTLYNLHRLRETDQMLVAAVLPHLALLPAEARIGVLSLATRTAFHLAEGTAYRMRLDQFYALEQKIPPAQRYGYYSELADLLAGTHQTEAAITAVNRAVTHFDPQAHAHRQPYLLKNLAKFYDDLGDSAAALATLESIDLTEADNDFLADYYLVLGDIRLALQEENAAITAEAAYRDSIRYAAAEPHLSHRLSAAYNNLARLYNHERRLQESLTYYHKSLEIDRANDHQAALAIGEHNVGAAYLELDQLEPAEKHLKRALHLRLRRFGTLDPDSAEARYVSDEYNNTIEMLVEVLLRRRQIDQAYRYALYGARIDTTEALVEIEQRPLPRPRATQAILAYFGSRREHLICFVHTTAGLEASFIFVTEPPADLQQKLNRFRQLTHHPGRLQKSYRTDLPDWCRYYAARIGDASKWRTTPGRTVTRRVGRFLYDALIGEIETHFSDREELIIVADYTLALVPFAALIRPDGAWLTERYAVNFLEPLPATGRTRRRGTENALVFGATDYATPATPDLPSLPAGRKEATYVHDLLPRARLRLNDADFLAHLDRNGSSGVLAGHATLHCIGHAGPDRSEQDMALFFPGPDGQIVEIRAGQINKWVLNAQLVFLSACSTGAGRVFAGWGVNSLGRAFLVAGARTVVTNSWPVFDRESAELTRRFYTDWSAASETEKPTVLSRLQRNCARGIYGAALQQPFVWSGLKQVFVES